MEQHGALDAVDDLPTPDPPRALGMVLEEDRGSLPYSLIHGEPLVRCAVIAMEQAGIDPIDPDTPWWTVMEWLEGSEVLVMHDALCPLTPPDFLARCASRAAATGGAVVGYRPVTDSVKQVEDGHVGAAVDREQLRLLVSPVALPAALARSLPPAHRHDLAALVAELTERGDQPEWLEAPASARRVAGPEDVRILEALTG